MFLYNKARAPITKSPNAGFLISAAPVKVALAAVVEAAAAVFELVSVATAATAVVKVQGQERVSDVAAVTV